MKYAGFWQRFLAGVVDSFVLMIPLMVLTWLGSLSQSMAVLCALPLGLLYWGYCFLFHAATGQTIGKKSVHIRVVRLDGSRIGRSESFKRGVVDLLFAIASITGVLWGVCSIAPGQFEAASWSQREVLIHLASPPFAAWVDTAANIWVWSEVIVMLFNQRRRSIHDFIAGTVVVDESAQPVFAPHANRPARPAAR